MDDIYYILRPTCLIFIFVSKYQNQIKYLKLKFELMRNHLTHLEILKVLSVEMTKWSTILTRFVEIGTFHLKGNIFPSIYMTNNDISFSNLPIIIFC